MARSALGQRGTYQLCGLSCCSYMSLATGVPPASGLGGVSGHYVSLLHEAMLGTGQSRGGGFRYRGCLLDYRDRRGPRDRLPWGHYAHRAQYARSVVHSTTARKFKLRHYPVGQRRLGDPFSARQDETRPATFSSLFEVRGLGFAAKSGAADRGPVAPRRNDDAFMCLSHRLARSFWTMGAST
jgi:hypothetical protein